MLKYKQNKKRAYFKIGTNTQVIHVTLISIVYMEYFIFIDLKEVVLFYVDTLQQTNHSVSSESVFKQKHYGKI